MKVFGIVVVLMCLAMIVSLTLPTAGETVGSSQRAQGISCFAWESFGLYGCWEYTIGPIREAASRMREASLSSGHLSQIIAAGLDIAAAKKLDDLSSVSLDLKTVTAIFPDCLYIAETDRYAGIKIVPTEAPIDLIVSDEVYVDGTMQTGLDGERYISGAVTPD